VVPALPAAVTELCGWQPSSPLADVTCAAEDLNVLEMLGTNGLVVAMV
jgi:hypothetical protein